jgi:hypothetical protein
MNNNCPRHLVQSLLSFPVKASLRRRDDGYHTAMGPLGGDHIKAKPPPILPSELWEMILSLLGNLFIKNFRLVHPQWAAIGAPYLFQTVYLIVHQHSVTGLIQIAGSTHATLVKKIVWSPLALWPECLEADRWRSTFKHILETVKHAELVELHKVYRRLFRDQTPEEPGNQISNLAIARGKLANCREFTICDGLNDVESIYGDPAFRFAVQRSSRYHRASI